MNKKKITGIASERRKPAHLLSVVVPFFNESPVLASCMDRLVLVCEGLDMPYELLFVDDGSEDGGGELLLRKAKSHSRIKVIRLSRNFGKEAAMTAGLDHAAGTAVIVLDADLQDPPELIPDMIQAWQEGADVVLMQRRTRSGESWMKRASAYLYYRLLNRISHHAIPQDVGDFRLMSRRAVDALKRLPERNRYMKGMFAWVGMETITLQYDRAPRSAGITKWDYLALIRLAIEGVTSFSIAPLHWSTFVGIAAASLGVLFGIWIVLKAMLLGDSVQGYPSLIAVITFLGGVQLFAIGVLGQYVGKTYLEAKQRPIYLIQAIMTPDQICSVSGLQQRLGAEINE